MKAGWLNGYFEEYGCGCVSETVRKKKDLIGYCPIHGDDRVRVYPDVNEVARRERGR